MENNVIFFYYFSILEKQKMTSNHPPYGHGDIHKICMPLKLTTQHTILALYLQNERQATIFYGANKEVASSISPHPTISKLNWGGNT